MERFACLGAVLALAGFVGSCAATPDNALVSTAFYAKIMRVDAVTLHRVAGGVRVTATGSTKTGAWIRPQLAPANYTPQGNVYRLEFLARPPHAPTTVVFTPIAASITIRPLPANVTAIRVVAENNSKTVRLP